MSENILEKIINLEDIIYDSEIELNQQKELLEKTIKLEIQPLKMNLQEVTLDLKQLIDAGRRERYTTTNYLENELKTILNMFAKNVSFIIPKNILQQEHIQITETDPLKIKLQQLINSLNDLKKGSKRLIRNKINYLKREFEILYRYTTRLNELYCSIECTFKKE